MAADDIFLYDNHMRRSYICMKYFSEEVFDFDGEMTQAKAHHLKKTFCGEFQAVFSLCHAVMVSSHFINACHVSATTTAFTDRDIERLTVSRGAVFHFSSTKFCNPEFWW